MASGVVYIEQMGHVYRQGVLEDNTKVNLMNDEYPKQLADISPTSLVT
jgi:hypothetical protein